MNGKEKFKLRCSLIVQAFEAARADGICNTFVEYIQKYPGLSSGYKNIHKFSGEKPQ